jgi:succinate-semialdehyde dehydrogenase/glutarate-semialdehyde dehydrogenase
MNLKDQALLRHQAFIDGEWQSADNGATFEVVDPSNGASLGTVPHMGAAETRRAIDAANAAWPAWRKKTAKERAAIMRRWYDLMIENADDLAMILTTEQGKPLAEAKGEIMYAASFIEWFAEEGKRVAGDTLASPAADKRIVVTKEPIGVCAAITPWNFPAAMITRKVGPALAAGCPIVVKPAEATPFSAFAMAVLAERAGVPKGVLNILTGDPKAIGGEMTSNPIVRKLSFTGSTAVGRLLAAQSAPTVKKVTLELGGNAPFIVFDDADLDAAVKARWHRSIATAGKPACARTGSTCTSVSTTSSRRSSRRRSAS